MASDPAASTTVADRVAACLEREGVEHVFGLPGEETEAILFALRDADVTFIPVRHEQGAAFMADVHGRLTGEAGVCLSTLGPGATNLLTGVADAQIDKSPLIAITGQGGLERVHKESHQLLDVVGLFQPVTKWNARLDDPDTVHESVRKAFKVAQFEKPGATHLELPEDVAAMETDAVPLAAGEPVRPAGPSRASLRRVTDAFDRADRPVIIAGNGAVRARAASELRRFVTATGVPVVSTYMGKGAVSDAEPYSLMTIDSGDHDEAATTIATADLVVAVGYDIAEHDPASWNRNESATVVHIDSQPAEVYEAYAPDVEVVADIEASLAGLAEWAGDTAATFDTGWYGKGRGHLVEDVDREPAEGAPFTVRGVLPVLRAVMAANDVLISDVGSHKLAIARHFPTYEPNTCIISNGLAAMGIAVPGAIAADLAVDGAVVAATGDGGFLMNAAELETASRIGCSFAIVVFVDDDYGMISASQREHRGESFGTRITNPDLVGFAESFGIDARRPETAEALADAVEWAVASDQLRLLEVPVQGTDSEP
jgi:acetolactate synthase-1/2/3 large subunit